MKEKLLTFIVWRLPKSLIYWCAVRLLVNATQDQYSDQVVPDLLAIDALKRWDTV